MIVFFVALILLQNISGRRDKLRLLDVGRRYAVAKQALHDAMQKEPVTLVTETGQLSVHGLIEQARESVDGMVWDAAERSGVIDLLIADPDGDGIDAAAIGLHILRTFRSRQQSGVPVKLDEDVRALGAATRDIPLTRPIGILRLRILASGEVEALLGSSVFSSDCRRLWRRHAHHLRLVRRHSGRTHRPARAHAGSPSARRYAGLHRHRSRESAHTSH
jgi:hypothetical protein